MIHSSKTINQIKILLKNAGLKNREVVEEMLDHYLSDIEDKIAENIDPQEAIEQTILKITQSDINRIQEKRKYNYLALLIGVIVTLIGFFAYHQFQYFTDQVAITHIQESRPVGPTGWPLEDAQVPISSNFGLRTHPIFKTQIHHKGIDIKAAKGTSVLATGKATVYKVGVNKNAGKYIILKHDHHFMTKYFHLSKIIVQEGSTVQKGEIIGEVGSTGMSTTPHLHYEIIQDNGPIDPLECINA